MKKIENIDSYLNKINTWYLIIFSISSYLAFQLYQTRKPIDDVKKVLSNIELYNVRPQEYYNQFRQHENDSLFTNFTNRIESALYSRGLKILNWEHYKNKQYVPARYLNHTKLDSNLTLNEVVNHRNSAKKLVYPDSIFDCTIPNKQKLKTRYNYTVTSINTNNLILNQDTTELSIQILPHKETKIGNQFFDNPIIVRCKCNALKLTQPEGAYNSFMRKGNWVYENYDGIKNLKYSKFNEQWQEKITKDLMSSETKIIGISIKNNSIGIVILGISSLYVSFIFLLLSELKLMIDIEKINFNFNWHVLFKNKYSKISGLFNIVLIPILTSINGAYLLTQSKIGLFTILFLLIILIIGVASYNKIVYIKKTNN